MGEGKLHRLLFPVLKHIDILTIWNQSKCLDVFENSDCEAINTRKNSGLNNTMPNICS